MGLSLKQSVKNKKISAQEAYSRLNALVDSEYKKCVPTLRWLKRLVDGKSITQNPNKEQNKKLNFPKNKNSLR